MERKSIWQRRWIRAAGGCAVLAVLLAVFSLGRWSQGTYENADVGIGAAELTAVQALNLCASPPCGEVDAAAPRAGTLELEKSKAASGKAGIAAAEAVDGAMEQAEELQTMDELAPAVSVQQADPGLQISTMRQELHLWRSEHLAREKNEAANREQAALVQRALMDAVASLLGEIRLLSKEVESLQREVEHPAESRPQGESTAAAVRWYFDSIRYLDGRQFALVRQRRAVHRTDAKERAGEGSSTQGSEEEIVYLLRVGESLGRWRIRQMDNREHRLMLEDTKTGQLRSVPVASWWQ